MRHARELGFEVEAIRELLTMSERPEQSCADADRIARRCLDEVIGALLSLGRFVSSCDACHKNAATVGSATAV